MEIFYDQQLIENLSSKATKRKINSENLNAVKSSKINPNVQFQNDTHEIVGKEQIRLVEDCDKLNPSMNEKINKLMERFQITPFKNNITLYDLQSSYRKTTDVKINYYFEEYGLAYNLSFKDCKIIYEHEPFKVLNSDNREIFGYVTIKSKYLTFTGICFDFRLIGGILNINQYQFSDIDNVTLFTKKSNGILSKVKGKFNVTKTSEIEFDLFCFSYRLGPFGDCSIQISRKDRNGELLLTGSMDDTRRSVSLFSSFLPLYYHHLSGYIIQGNVKWNVYIKGETVLFSNDRDSITLPLIDFWLMVSAIPTMSIILNQERLGLELQNQI